MRAPLFPLGLFLFSAIFAAAADSSRTVAAYDAILAGTTAEQTTIALGDMIVPVATLRLWRDQLAGTAAPGSASQSGINKWPGGIVYYVFNANVSAAHRTATLDGMAEWAAFAGLTFTPRTAEANYVMINDGGAGLNGGNSALGMAGGAQQLNIGATSWNRGTIVHEIGHALGLIHEHQRSDRDTFVTINFSNVAGGMTDGNFIRIPTSTNNGLYDFLSVMHYGRKTLAVNPAFDTITPNAGYTQFLDSMGGFGDRVLSRGDRNGIALMYTGAPATSTLVTNTKDAGPGSLRTAIYKAFDAVTDVPTATPAIVFNIPNTDPNFAGGVITITPTDRLPAPGPRVTIDAGTQTLFTGNTNANGPEIVLNGTVQSAEPSTYGLGLQFLDANITVSGFVIQAFESRGILITGAGATGCTVAGCYIGTNAAGTAAVANGIVGIEINGGATANRIGGTTAAARNVVSGNVYQGIYINGAGTNGNIVEGNYVGTNAAGTAAIPNGTAFHFAGVEIGAGASGNLVGGTVVGARNVLSGNTGQGAAILNASGNFIRGNFAGLNAAGTAALPNTYAGIELANAATNNVVGGTAAGAGNVLSGNTAQGVALTGVGTSGNVVAGNFIGTNPAGTAAIGNGTPGVRYSGVGLFTGATGNTIGGTAAGSGNVISGNTGQGVLLQNVGTSNNSVIGNWIGLNAAGTGAVANFWSGIEITGSASANTVGGTSVAARNVISGNSLQGVYLNGAGTTGNVVAGNFIGTNVAGTAAMGNAVYGIDLFNSAAGNTIGGTAPGAGNVISGNGIRNITVNIASNNTIAGNLIGLNAAGTAALANPGVGIAFFGGSQGNTVGGTGGGRNFICGNTNEGIAISDGGTNANVIVGNSIGVTPAGAVIANTGNGISIFGGPQNNVIGGSTPGAANLLSGNSGSGIALYDAATTGTRINGNAIYANNGLGIDLGGFGVSANDANDTDTGANNLQNFPVLTSATVGVGTTVIGTLNSNTSAGGITYRIEFFANPPGLPTGNDEGQNFLGAINVTTNASGGGSFNSVLPTVVPASYFLTATATDPAGNTSEFSAARQVSFTDSEPDGLPDAYELANWPGIGTTTGAADSDGDGMTNVQEFRAGTNPRDATSFFRLAPPLTAGADKTLRLVNLAGGSYRIDYADLLGSPTLWRILADQIPGSASVVVITDPGAAALPQRFYRAVVP